MFFTHEDYRKIEEYLKRKSIKDTQFNEAITPLDGTEEVAFVQKGKNVKAHVKDIVDQLFLLGVSDFLNVTDKYHQSYIDLKEAIDLIPFLARKKGQVITFINKEGDWVIYQYKGTTTLQWRNTTLWVNLFESIYINSILPDEEDLTKTSPDEQGNVRLKLKDKIYNPEEFSGLGRIYLRKNMVEGKNVLIQEMISEANIIYHIQYDYDLNEQEITIPENCILKFEGGSFKNGTLSGNKSLICADSYKILYDITVKGTFISDLNAIWIGAISNDENFDNSTIITTWWTKYAKFGFLRLYFPKGTYYFSSQIQLTPNVQYARLDGCNSTFISNISNDYFIYNYTPESYNEYFVLENIVIRSEVSKKSTAIYIRKSNMWTISNVNIWNFEYGIKLTDTYYGVFDGYNSIRGCRVAIITEKGGSAEINTIDFRNIKISPCSIDTVRLIYPLESMDEDEWYMKYGRCGIDAYTSFLGAKFEGMTIEGCDYAMRFNRIPRETVAKQSGLINISQCYFEANTKYDLYFGKGNTSILSGYNMSIYVINVDKCLFNSGNIHLEEGEFTFTNIGGGNRKLNFDRTSSDYELKLYVDSTHNYIGNWGGGRVTIINNIKGTEQPNFNDNPYQIAFYPKLQNGLIESYRGGVPTEGDLTSTSGTTYPFRKCLGVSSIFGNSIKLEDYFFRNVIGFGSTVNGGSNKILIPSGNQAIIKPQSSRGYNIYSKGEGIPFYILYKYFTEESEYSGYVQEVFNDEIYIDNATHTIRKVSDNSIVGYGKKYALTNPVSTNGTTLINVETGKLNIFITSRNKYINYIDIIKGYKSDSDIIEGYNQHPEVVDSLPPSALLNEIVLLTTDSKYYIFNGVEWVEFTKITQRYEYNSYGHGLSERPINAEYRGQTYTNIDTGMIYGYLGVLPTTNKSLSRWVSLSIGTINKLSDTKEDYQISDIVYCKEINKHIIWDGTSWIEEDKVLAGTLRIGTFAQKPTKETNFIYKGFAYFCTDKQTIEGTRNGIMIYYAGDNTWVDSLGRVVE